MEKGMGMRLVSGLPYSRRDLSYAFGRTYQERIVVERIRDSLDIIYEQV